MINYTKIEEIELDPSEIYVDKSYPNDGIFIAGDSVVLRANSIVIYLCESKDFHSMLISESEIVVNSVKEKMQDAPLVVTPEEKPSISEEFALKAMAIATGQKYKDIT